MAGTMVPFQVAPAGTVVTANKNFQPFDITGMDWKGILLFINVSAVSGTNPTLQVSIQIQDPISQSWIQIPGVITPILSAQGLVTLAVGPGVTPIANQQISAYISNVWRAAVTVGGTNPSFTISIQSIYIP
jgi:hypothetical protein